MDRVNFSNSTNQESPEQLQSWLAHYARSYRAAIVQKEKCEKLMSRDSSKNWNADKTAKMVRRLNSANKILESAELSLREVTKRLSKLGIEVDIESGIEALKLGKVK